MIERRRSIFMEKPLALSLLMAAVAAIGGCAVNPRPGFDQVNKTIYERTGQHAVWETGGPEDRQVHTHVEQLLSEELTADDAVEVALLNNPDIQATYEDLGIAQADLVQAGLLANPVISANMRFPGRPHYPFEINVEEEFMQLFFLPLRKKVAAAGFEQAKAQVAAAVIRQAAEARSAFYKLQGAMQLLELRQMVLEGAQANADASRRLREAGNTRELDYANDQGLLAQARLDVSMAEGEVADAREDLGSLMGVWGLPTGKWRIGTRLPVLPPSDGALEGLESQAVAQRQDLLAARNGTLAAARTVGFANYAALFSGASLGVDAAREPDVKSTIGPAISAPIPIFDQGQAAGARAQAQFRQAQAHYQALAIQIRSQIRKAYAHITIARQQAAYYHDFVIPLRHRILEQTQLQYNGMFIGVSGLLFAKQEEINAGAKYVESLRNYWVARCELEQAVGGRVKDGVGASTRPDSAPKALATPPKNDMNSMSGMDHAQ